MTTALAALQTEHAALRKGLFSTRASRGRQQRAAEASRAEAQAKWDDWHEKYGFHTTDPVGHAMAHASLHLRLAHMHHARGEHAEADAHFQAHQAHHAVAKPAKGKRANPFKAAKLTEKAFGATKEAHMPARPNTTHHALPAGTAAPEPADIGTHGFRHAAGSVPHTTAHSDLHFRMAQFHQARGETAAAAAHYAAHQARSGGAGNAAELGHHAWTKTTFA